MSLDISKLEKVRIRGQKTTARCPACAESGGDNKGEHLIMNNQGQFGCVVHAGDGADAKEHRRRIFALCGDRKPKPLVIHRTEEMLASGRLGRSFQSHPENASLKTGLLGRLGRVFETHLETERARAGNEDRITEKLNDFGRGVPGVLSTSAAESHGPLSEQKWAGKQRLRSLLQPPFVMVHSLALDEILFFCQDEATKAALLEAGASEWSIYTKAELKVLCEQNRIAPLSADELRKVHEIKKTFNARIQ
jgi:hypothetical protein